ncbi:MAG: hypothetical protein GY856_50805 [bacterium]|nr:hypothetical protein [bacterium]
MPEPVELNIFKPGGTTYEGLRRAQEFFEEHVTNVGDIAEALSWMTEELGEAASTIRRREEGKYLDAVGDLTMWCITLARLLDIGIAEALDYSTRQLVAKGYTDLPPGNIEID